MSSSSRNRLMQEAFAGNMCGFKKFAAELDDGKGIAATVTRVRDAKGLSALHHAAMGGAFAICRYLIHDLKLDVNMKGDKKGETPVFLASLRGHKSTIVYLLKMGGNPDVRDEIGLTPLYLATDRGNSELAHLLLSHGANVDAVSGLGTPLERAASRSPEIVKLLLDHHANPNLSASRAYTPLSFAVSANYLQCVELLLEAGAHPDKAGASGGTPLLIAAAEGWVEITRCLLKYGANPDLISEEGVKPVEVAAICANCDCVKMLFPVTSPIPWYPDWSFVGVMKHVHSREAREQRNRKTKELFAGAKSKGDRAFHEKDYRMALFDYSRAIAGDPSSAILLSNRSLCFARLSCYGEEALTDAKNCILLKPDWPKGYYRAGVACNILRKFDQAAVMFMEGLKLDPKNVELRKAYQEAVEACNLDF